MPSLIKAAVFQDRFGTGWRGLVLKWTGSKHERLSDIDRHDTQAEAFVTARCAVEVARALRNH